MHKIADKEFTLDDFSHEHLFDSRVIVEFSEEFEDNYIVKLDSRDFLLDTIEALNSARKLYLKAKIEPMKDDTKRALLIKKCWWQMIQLLPSSYNQRRTVMLNYEVLANIYKSRKNHKLDEWCVHETSEEHKFRNKDFASGMWGFCDWIESLPYSELITKKGENNNEYK